MTRTPWSHSTRRSQSTRRGPAAQSPAQNRAATNALPRLISPLLAVLMLFGVAFAVAMPQIGHAQTPNTVDVQVDPGSGPSGTSATITITGANPGDPITVTIDGGVTTAIADANGKASVTHTFFGRPNDVVSISVIAGNGLDSPSDSTTFTITGEPNGIQLFAGANLVAYTGPTTDVREAVNSAQELILGLWSLDAATQNWSLWSPVLPDPLNGFSVIEHGHAYVVVASATGTWNFPTTGAPPPISQPSTPTTPSTPQTPLTLDVAPTGGPNGTTATNTVRGAAANATVILDIVTGDTLTNSAAANGIATFSYTFFGEPGEVLTMTAYEGDLMSSRTASGTFTLDALEPLTVSIQPNSGPNGTIGTIVITHAKSAEPLILELNTGDTFTFVAPPSGSLATSYTFFGEVGEILVATVWEGQIGSTRVAQDIFTIEATPVAPSGNLVLNLSPSSGPSGTTSTITVSNAAPGQIIQVEIGNGDSHEGTANAQGVATFSQTFFGEPESLSVIAGAGQFGDQRVVQSAFTITS
jgi:hypothetical protein